LSETVTTAPVFAPSELVILFGDRFVPLAPLLGWKEEVLTSGVKVSAEALTSAAMAAALYAVQHSGAGRLEAQRGAALFGLMKTRKLVLSKGPASASFPAGSLEAYLLKAVEGGEEEVDDVLKAFIGEPSSDPSQRTLGLLKRGMSERGLLEAQMKRAFVFFSTTAYALPAATRRAAEAQPLEPVLQLLREMKWRDPELDREVQVNIDRARDRATLTAEESSYS
jgi:hypothetical protein